MPNIMAAAAPQQSAASSVDAFNHLAPVVDLLSRSLAKSKYQQGAGARRWPMAAVLAKHAYDGLKSLLALVGVVSIGTLLLLPLVTDSARDLSALATEAFFEPSTIVAGPIQVQAETPLE